MPAKTAAPSSLLSAWRCWTAAVGWRCTRAQINGQTRNRDMAGNPTGGPQTANLTANPPPRLRFPACELCGQPISRRGYAVTSIAAARERGRHRRHHRDQEPPPLVPWRFRHADCDPDRTAPDAYFISQGASRTARRLLIEVLKLSLHDWYEETDWRRVVAQILAESRPPPDDA